MGRNVSTDNTETEGDPGRYWVRMPSRVWSGWTYPEVLERRAQRLIIHGRVERQPLLYPERLAVHMNAAMTGSMRRWAPLRRRRAAIRRGWLWLLLIVGAFALIPAAVVIGVKLAARLI